MEDYMKKMIGFLFTSFLLLGILLGSASCIFSSKTVEEYKDYRCYDYHLRYLNTSKSIGKYKLEEDNTVYNIDYKKIIGEDETEMIGATISSTAGAFSSEYYPRVLQNPQMYFSIIDDWTIEKMQFCLYNITKEEQSVIFESSDSNDIEAFRTLLSLEDYSSWKPDSGYVNELSKTGDEKQLYLRIVFSESENVVWETEIKSYFNQSLNERVFSIDLGKEIQGYSDISVKMKKTEDPTLQLLFTEAFNRIDLDS